MRVTRISIKAAVSVYLVSMMAISPLSVLAANTAKPQYLPPIAPSLDRSAFGGDSVAPAIDRSDSSDSNDYTQADSVESAPDRTKSLLRTALEKHNAGDLNGAKNVFRQVLSIDPRNVDANFNLGAMAEDSGDLQAALGYYKTASAASPSDSDIKDALTSVQQKMNQKQQQQSTAMALQKKNELRNMAQDAATAYKAGNYDKAIGLLEQIDRQAPNDANVKYGLGQAYRGKGDMARATANLQAAASIDPSNQLYQNTLADAKRQGSSPQVARAPQGGSGPAGMQYDDGGPSGNGNKDYGSGGDIPPTQVADDGSPAGQITPFTSQGAPNNALYGHASGYGGGSGGGMSLGGLGMGLLGGGLGSMMMGGSRGGYGYGNPYQSRGSRLVRGAAIGAGTGAAIGALTNMGRGGYGMKSGAMRGAMMGGLFGMLSGF